jgi:hypothetical protein
MEARRKRRVKAGATGGCLFMLFLYLLAPILLARGPVGASWPAILIAYAVWPATLLLFFAGQTKKLAEVVGWSLIFGMFLTIPAIPLIALAIRLAGVA